MSIKEHLSESKQEQERARGLGALAAQARSTRELRALVRGLSVEIDELHRDLAISVGTAGLKGIKLPRSPRRAASPMTPVCLWSDWHIEELIPLDQTNNRNEYTPEIAQARYERLLEQTVALIQREGKTHSISEVVVWLGGDYMSGHIHDDLREITQTSPLDTSLIVYEMLRGGLEHIAEKTKSKILVPTSYGNHGRITSGKPRIATAAAHNLEQMIYKSLARDLKDDDRFVFDVTPTAFKYLDLGDYRIRFNHGDAFRYGGGVGGIHIPLNRAVSRWDQETPADLTCVGHWHQRLDLQHSVCNGSLCGTSEYSRRFGFEPPAQQVFFVDRERNRKTGVHPIFVDV